MKKEPTEPGEKIEPRKERKHEKLIIATAYLFMFLAISSIILMPYGVMMRILE